MVKAETERAIRFAVEPASREVKQYYCLEKVKHTFESTELKGLGKAKGLDSQQKLFVETVDSIRAASTKSWGKLNSRVVEFVQEVWGLLERSLSEEVSEQVSERVSEPVSEQGGTSMWNTVVLIERIKPLLKEHSEFFPGILEDGKALREYYAGEWLFGFLNEEVLEEAYLKAILSALQEEITAFKTEVVECVICFLSFSVADSNLLTSNLLNSIEYGCGNYHPADVGMCRTCFVAEDRVNRDVCPFCNGDIKERDFRPIGTLEGAEAGGVLEESQSQIRNLIDIRTTILKSSSGVSLKGARSLHEVLCKVYEIRVNARSL